MSSQQMHVYVATSMVVAGVLVALGQDWLKVIRNWVGHKTDVAG